jgi:hypothetical protein
MKTLLSSIFFFGLIINVNAISLVKDTVELKEFFVDSLNIGRKKYNKIELSRYQTSDSGWVIIKFYAKSNEKRWVLKQTFRFEKDDIRGCNMKLLDFNNDGLKDMTYIQTRRLEAQTK